MSSGRSHLLGDNPPPYRDVTAIVLAGGRSERFGSDKIVASLRGRSLLDHVLAGLPGEWEVVVVGPERPASRAVRWVVEEPPDGGPLAGIVAGAVATSSEVVVVVAGDMPWSAGIGALLANSLTEAPPELSAVVALDDEGQENPLLAAYRRTALLEAAPKPAHGRRAKLLLDLPHRTVPVPGAAARDVDRPADLHG